MGRQAASQSIFIAAASLQLLSDPFEQRGERAIHLRDAAGIVRSEIDGDAIIDVGPFGMMIQPLDRRRGGHQESDGMSEIREAVFAVQLAMLNFPARQRDQSFLDLRGSEFVHKWPLYSDY